MGVQDFKPDSELGNNLKNQIAERLAALNTEDPLYVAEFLLVLISNNRSPVEIVEEFTGLFGAIIDEKFVQEVINEILNQQNGTAVSQPPQIAQTAFPNQIQQSEQQQQQQQQVHIQPAQSAFTPQQINIPVQPSAFNQTEDNNKMFSGSDSKEVRFSDAAQSSFRPTYNNDNNFNNGNNKFNFTKSNRGSMNFKSNRGGRTINNKRQNTMSKMIEMSLDNNMDMTTNVVSNKPTERCKDFPHCPNKLCQFAHPTRICRNFPNCPNQNQTCTFLHPGEDDELFKEYERVRDAKYQQKTMARQPVNSGITLCKFGTVCQKELCPFGHPTPANKDAKVTLLQWCVDNKNCKDVNCTRAHSSPNYQPQQNAHASDSSSAMAVDSNNGKTLEQCKFGSFCKNFRCPKRHATSTVLCRDGANCIRIDCFFQHPIDEVCKYGVNCTNATCAFQHPDGKQAPSNGQTSTGNKVWINGQNQDTGSTSQRQFAVSEDQILEQAPPQEV
jgi:hypothetical protein